MPPAKSATARDAETCSSADAASRPGVGERLALIDALRGIALFGVLLVNMLGFAGFENSLTAAQVEALTASRIEKLLSYGIELLVYAKAIGIFTFLFGVGFALQMRSLEKRETVDPHGLYVRRLVGLLAMGMVHWWFLWSGEILHIYAVGGMLLMLVSRWQTGTLLAVGLLAAVLGRPLVGQGLALLTTGNPSGVVFDDAIFAERFEVYMHGSLADILVLQFWQDCVPQITTGVWAAAVVHALGRFMVGAAILRRGYLENAGDYRRGYVLVAVAGLLVGAFAQRDWLLREALAGHGWITDPAWLRMIGHIANSVGVTALTAAYIALFVLAWQWGMSRRLLTPFVPIGRMALTNYLIQTPVGYYLFCGFGLGWMGKVGPAGCLAISVLLFASQMVVSAWWLKRFRMGPMEWLWRWWTYGARPAFRSR